MTKTFGVDVLDASGECENDTSSSGQFENGCNAVDEGTHTMMIQSKR